MKEDPNFNKKQFAFYARAYQPPSPARKGRRGWCNTLVELKVLQAFPPEVLASGAVTNQASLKSVKQKELLVGAHGH